MRIPIFACPSDPVEGDPPSSSYAGCHNDVEAPIDVDNNGVLFLNSGVRYDDITDGSSNTIYVGEKRNLRVDLGWMSGTRATLRNTGTRINPDADEDPLGALAPPEGRNFWNAPGQGDADGKGLELVVGGFSSHHSGQGAQFCMGDGSVRYMPKTIDMEVYQRLGHRADGELIRDIHAQTGH